MDLPRRAHSDEEGFENVQVEIHPACRATLRETTCSPGSEYSSSADGLLECSSGLLGLERVAFLSAPDSQKPQEDMYECSYSAASPRVRINSLGMLLCRVGCGRRTPGRRKILLFAAVPKGSGPNEPFRYFDPLGTSEGKNGVNNDDNTFHTRTYVAAATA